jgi:xylulose-5-phosphate/fructose-6-phosphate phosphoketolase
MCQGWLEGYLLTGRHGLFSSYEAFIHIVDSMFNQHAKWLKVCRDIPWRRPIASLNYLLSSHVWRQDHNGFSHQDPGFIDHVMNKKADIVRVYLPPDARTLSYPSPITACAAKITSTLSLRANSQRRNGCRWTKRSGIALLV